MLNIDRVFVCHHQPLADRKICLLDKLKNNNIDVVWVEDFKGEDIKNVLSAMHKDHPDAGKPVPISLLSLYLKHEKIFNIQKNENLENVLILEDDVDIPNGFESYFNACMKEFAEMNGDLLFLGICCGLEVRNHISNKLVYHEPQYRTRCTHCYVVNKKCLPQILSRIKEYDDAIDWKLNRIIDEFGLKCCWASPAIYQCYNFATSLKPNDYSR